MGLLNMAVLSSKMMVAYMPPRSQDWEEYWVRFCYFRVRDKGPIWDHNTGNYGGSYSMVFKKGTRCSVHLADVYRKARVQVHSTQY